MSRLGVSVLVACFFDAACSPSSVALPVTDAATGRTDTPPAVDRGAPSDAVDSSVEDGGILPPTDAGEPFADAGTLGAPAWVPLTIRVDGGCDPAGTCGGSVLGTWDVSGGCFDLPVPAQLSACPGAQVSETHGQARGRVTFLDTVAQRHAQWEVDATISVPAICAGFVGGCPGLQTLIRGAFADSACVADSAGGCRCAVRQTGAIDDGDAYTTASGQIISTLSGKRWNYCVTPGDSTHLRYDDASPSGAREPGVIDLVRRP